MSPFLAVVLALAASAVAEDKADPLVQMVVGLLNEKDKDLRAVGLEQVRSEAKGPEATRQFAAQLPKLPPDAQVGLLSALADRKDVAARPAVLEILASSQDAAVKVAAIEALGQLGETADLGLLVPLLTSTSKTEKEAARASLVRLRGETVPGALIDQINKAPATTRVALIEILVTRRALDAVPHLLSAALDADPVVRAAAMSALGQLAGPEQVPGMVQGVLKAKKGSEREAAERAVMLVCSRTPEVYRRAEPLLTAMDSFSETDRVALLSTLGRVGGSAALKMIEAAIADPDPGRHEIGLRALCNWPDASIAPRLIELNQTDKHAEHQALALAALIRVAPLPDKRTNSDKLALLEKALSLCTRDAERNQVLKRARAIRAVETLRFLMPYLDQPAFAQQACESVVELAHHRELREPNKAEFEKSLDKVIETSQDPVVVERANRYKKNQTWARPTVIE